MALAFLSWARRIYIHACNLNLNKCYQTKVCLRKKTSSQNYALIIKNLSRRIWHILLFVWKVISISGLRSLAHHKDSRKNSPHGRKDKPNWTKYFQMDTVIFLSYSPERAPSFLQFTSYWKVSNQSVNARTSTVASLYLKDLRSRDEAIRLRLRLQFF